jgi:hypothetical protein
MVREALNNAVAPAQEDGSAASREDQRVWRQDRILECTGSTLSADGDVPTNGLACHRD